MQVGDRVEVDTTEIAVIEACEPDRVVVRFQDGWRRCYKPKEVQLVAAEPHSRGSCK